MTTTGHVTPPIDGSGRPSSAVARLAERAAALARTRRVVLGIAGPPGAGKTTLARSLVSAITHSTSCTARHVPMDGFHLADAELERLGRLPRKGAPDTFDVEGYRALLARLLDEPRVTTIYAPSFDRVIEQPLAGAIPVDPRVDVIISEGNYLLDEGPGWGAVRACFDEIWWVDAAEPERNRRLVDRHETFGKTAQEARAWVYEVDSINAERIVRSRHHADLHVPGDLDVSDCDTTTEVNR